MQRIPVSTAAVVIGLCALWVALGSRIWPTASKHDFLNLYTGGRLALEGRFHDLHDTDVQLEYERRLVPDLPQLVPFVRPVFYAAALAPMAAMPYRTAFVTWTVLQVALLLACWIWAWRRFGPDALVFAALSLPAPLGIASGQDCVVMLALLIVAFELSDRGHNASAGAVLALMLFKFHLVLLWPIALIVQRRWRMLAGYSATAAALAMISLALGGIADARLYITLLQNKSLDHLAPSPELMISYQGFFANLGVESRWPVALFIGVVIAILLIAARHRPTLFILTPVASLLIAPHVYGYDAALLMVPLLVTIFETTNKAARIAATLLSTPVPFGMALADKPWAIASSASLIAFFLISATNRSVTVAARQGRQPVSEPRG
jgi:glycosyl transferase family 87